MDPAELAFATAAYAEATRRWNDERVRRAMDLLLPIIGERGEFPAGRPIRTLDLEYRLHATNADVIRALARVLEHAYDVDFAPVVAERMVSHFDTGPSPDAPVEEEPPPLEDWERRRKSADILALTAVQRMLDARINHLVFSHFSVKRAGDLKLRLTDLFYPDYGLTSASNRVEEESPPGEAGSPPYRRSAKDASMAAHGVYRRRSVAEVLELMRAHVEGLVQSDETDPTFSLVLHGPPGTGKTTMVEALAKTCGVPMLEVTPSDIVIAGVDAIESQARAVFYALSLLTHVVILLDEFDPVLLRRSPQEKSPSAFSFLTPGMLPKLKTLHDRAEERSVAYVLVTNLIGKLDEAAIRGGRFDVHLGIYPPDLLSRFGRLWHEVTAYERSPEAQKHEMVAIVERVWEVVRRTAGRSMNTLGKPGWFTVPNKELTQGKKNAFSYMFEKDDEFEPPPPETYLGLLAISPELENKVREALRHPQASADSPSLSGSGEEEATRDQTHAEREFKEWAWTTCWDKTALVKAAPDEHDLPSPPDADHVDDEWARALNKWGEQDERASGSG